jgi:hypothetical protein
VNIAQRIVLLLAVLLPAFVVVRPPWGISYPVNLAPREDQDSAAYRMVGHHFLWAPPELAKEMCDDLDTWARVSHISVYPDTKTTAVEIVGTLLGTGMLVGILSPRPKRVKKLVTKIVTCDDDQGSSGAAEPT